MPALSEHIWDTRYRHRTNGKALDATLADTWRRVALALAAGETADRPTWSRRFRDTMRDGGFLPGGRILAGAGTSHAVTLSNCFVMGTIEDSIPGIFRALQEGALTMQQGGGVGYDFSTLRPHGTRAKGANTVASGPVSFMRVWDAMCATVMSTGARRGAMMATLRCDHPDILAFIDAKREAGQLRHFNLSVLVTDAFMQAVRADAAWALTFTRHGPKQSVPARRIWDALLRASYDRGEPGVLFIDRINRMNNLGYCERITATNPCGEIPLPPYGACNLGSINLAQLILDPFGPDARLDADALDRLVPVAVRMLDNAIDISRYPLEAQKTAALRARRIGLGVTGLADALTMLGLRYGEEASLDFARQTMQRICHAAYRASVDLAGERGSFPAFDRDKYLAAPFVAALPEDIRDGIARRGIRNSHLLAIAPAGTISLLAGNVSSGIEPAFAAEYRRDVLDADGVPVPFDVVDHAVRLWREKHPGTGLPPAFVAATDVPIAAHLDMQATLQAHVDNAISKTIHVPADCNFDDFAKVYELADEKGLKGCTVFRARPGAEAVLSTAPHGAEAPHCCTPGREQD